MLRKHDRPLPRLFVLFVLHFGAFGVTAGAAEMTDPEGRWTGTIGRNDPNFGELTLSEISLVFTHDVDHALRATCYAAVWGETEWPLTAKVAPKRPTLSLELVTRRGGHGRFEFGMPFDANKVSGVYTYQGVQYTVSLRKVRADDRPQPRASQVPLPPLPNIYQKVRFKSGTTALAGLLILPKGPGPFPVAILIPGSEPSLAEPDVPGDPEADVWMWVIAHSLARHGIATLQTDSRGLGGSEGSFMQMTLQDAASDVRASIRFLGTRKEVDPKRIGLLGHSMGTAVAALTAADEADLRFMVLLSGVGLPGDQVLLEQAEIDWEEEPLRSDPARQTVRRMDVKLYAMAKAGIAREEITRKLHAEFAGRPFMSRWADEKQIEATATRVTYPRWRSFLSYEPRPTLAQCRLPVFAVSGASDTWVSSKRNLPLIEAALKAGGNKNVKVLEIADLSHMLHHVRGEYDPADIIDAAVLESIAQWIKNAAR